MDSDEPYKESEEKTKNIKVTKYLLNKKSAYKPSNMYAIQIPKYIVIHEVSRTYKYSWCNIEHYRRLILLHSTPANKTLKLNEEEVENRKKLGKLELIDKNIFHDIENGDLINISNEIMNKNMDFEQEKNGAPPYIGWGSSVGYHYLVSDKKIYQFIPDDISSEHTGTDYGNNNSIGIERIVCLGTDWRLAIHNQAKLAATLMVKFKIPLNRVVTHKRMQELFGDDEQKNNPKECPNALIRGINGNLKDFFNEIVICLNNLWLYEEKLDLGRIKKEDLEFIEEQLSVIEYEKNTLLKIKLISKNIENVS